LIGLTFMAIIGGPNGQFRISPAALARAAASALPLNHGATYRTAGGAHEGSVGLGGATDQGANE